MSRAPSFTQADVAQAEPQSMVYFVQIGKHIKIGFTTNLEGRLKAFQTSSADVDLLLSLPGDRALERSLHDKLSECRIARELFRREYRVLAFMSKYKRDGLAAALQFLDETDSAAIARRKAEDRVRRVAVARQTKAEKDAYFASLVAERKNRIGW